MGQLVVIVFAVMPDGVSEEGNAVLLNQLHCLEKLVLDLKCSVTAAGKNGALAASCILDKEKCLSSAFDTLRNDAEDKAKQVSDEIFTIIMEDDEGERQRETETFWSHFHEKLGNLEPTSTHFKGKCLFRDLGRNHHNSTLLHEVCRRNPPAEVLETLLDSIPINTKSWGIDPPRQFNHLASTSRYERASEYPLHMVLMHGGSFEIIKLLINADVEKRTLKDETDHECLLFRVLIQNKDQHLEDDFSKILRHLALTVNTKHSQLLYKEHCAATKAPLELLWKSLKISGLSDQEILKNSDFVFLLKATCYHHSMHQKQARLPGEKNLIIGYEQKLHAIEHVTMSCAVIVCAPCFDMSFVTEVLPYLSTIEPRAFLEKDENGKHCIHNIIRSEPSFNDGYFLWSWESRAHFDTFKESILSLILKIAPQCARQLNGGGRLPLHVAADAHVRPKLSAVPRLRLVNMIYNACPDAAGVMDKATGLPPFALSMRGVDKKNVRKRQPKASLPSAFYLLKAQPEILEYIASLRGTNSETACPPTKRRKSQHGT